MAGDTERSPDGLGVALKGNSLLKRSFKQDKVTAQSSEPLNSAFNNRHKNARKNQKPHDNFQINAKETANRHSKLA